MVGMEEFRQRAARIEERDRQRAALVAPGNLICPSCQLATILPRPNLDMRLLKNRLCAACYDAHEEDKALAKKIRK